MVSNAEWQYTNLTNDDDYHTDSIAYQYQLPYRFQLYDETRSQAFVDYRENILKWCVDQYDGAPGDDNVKTFRYTFWKGSRGSVSILFRDEIDATAFKLRWWNDLP